MTTIDDWKDVKDLIEIADRLLEELDEEELVQMGNSGYYGKVIDKYKEFKNTTTKQG